MEHHLSITPTGSRGMDSDLPRYRVECRSCKVVVHEATTAPDIRVKEHLKGTAVYDREMTPEEANPERILCAANWIDDGEEHIHQARNLKTGIIIAGWRHHNCIASSYFLEGFPEQQTRGRNQGFITSKGNYVTRAEGRKIAEKAGQLVGHHIHSGLSLCSEDLY